LDRSALWAALTILAIIKPISWKRKLDVDFGCNESPITVVG